MSLLADLNLRMALQELDIRHWDRDAHYRKAVATVTERDGRPSTYEHLKRRYTLREVHRRREFGFCLECPNEAREGRAYCATCAERRRKNQQARRDAARRAKYGPPRTLRRFRLVQKES